ncbi:MAG TPA: hypothetical protein PLO63_12460 [Syntrophales bacterium]|nr:hypothetical protein [Syntrophales bacterium]
MLELDIPGFGKRKLVHLVLDFNGTIARDGRLIRGVGEILADLARDFSVHVLTADTFGGVQRELEGVPCSVAILEKEDQARAKAEYVRGLVPGEAVCIGNGRNDALMLREAALGIAVIQEEGAAGETLLAADVVVRDILDALDLLRRPLRLTATLRS